MVTAPLFEYPVRPPAKVPPVPAFLLVLPEPCLACGAKDSEPWRRLEDVRPGQGARRYIHRACESAVWDVLMKGYAPKPEPVKDKDEAHNWTPWKESLEPLMATPGVRTLMTTRPGRDKARGIVSHLRKHQPLPGRWLFENQRISGEQWGIFAAYLGSEP